MSKVGTPFSDDTFLRDRRTKVIWYDINGRVWHLSGYMQGFEGATLGIEPSKMYMADADLLYTEGARQDGASYNGNVISRREIDWEIQIAGRTIREYHLINTKWWEGWSMDKTGVLAFFTRENGWRWASARLVGNVEPKWNKDPALIKACDYDMTISVDSSLFDGRQEFGYWKNVSGSGNGRLTISNPGDQKVSVTYTMPGPGTYSIQDGPGGTMIPLTPIKAGQTLKVWSHNEKLICRVYDPGTGIDGRTAWTGYGSKRFRAMLEPRTVNEIKVSVTGGTVNSQVYATLTPRYFKPF